MTLETGRVAPEKKNSGVEKRIEAMREKNVTKDKIKERAKRTREANEKNEDVIWTYDEHELGKWEILDEKRVRDKAIEKGLDHRAIGGVDASSFNPDKVDQSFLLKMSDWADKFANLFVDGKIVSNFQSLESPATQVDILSIISDIALVSLKVKQGRFDLKEFKQKLESKYSSEMIYGPQGALNILLAIHRADEAIKGRDVGKYIYDIRVGKKKLSQSERFSELRQSRPHTGPGDASRFEAGKELEKSVGGAFGELNLLKDEYKAKYGTDLEIATRGDAKGESVVVVKVKTAEGAEKTFYFRLKVDGSGKITYSLSKEFMRDEPVYSSEKEAMEAFKSKLDHFIIREDKRGQQNAEAVEKIAQGKFMVRLQEFFGDKYIQEFYKGAEYSTKVDGVYAGGVEIKGASYALHIGLDTYFIFVDAARRTLEMKAVKEVASNKFAAVSLGEVVAGDLESKTDKQNLALKIMKVVEAFRKT